MMAANMEDSLVTRRSRRSTAGNRYCPHRFNLLEKISYALGSMEAALAEMALDTSQKEMDDDVDFINGKGLYHQLRGWFLNILKRSYEIDEEDVFESDFESTDEEAQDDADAGDKVVQEEEKRARKVSGFGMLFL